ncbi:MAG: cation acetate symporter [Phaeodactylibacter sp.]|nr:cation acetate symporter [Phaeodactylibacter sp.]MCB9289510.1 cation acetate symporter [Lewinellaceae bacterium]
MDVQTLTLIFVTASFLLYMAIAYWSKARSIRDFYVAGGGVSPFANGMATAADWMSAATFISLPGIVSFMGYDGAAYLLGGSGGFVLLAMLIAPYLRKFGKYTIPAFIGDRYYSNTARTIAVICAIFISFTYLAGQMRGVGVVFSRFLEMSIDTGVYVGAGIVFLYAVWGGMKGITYTQVAQYCVLIFAFLVPTIFLSILLTNNPIPFLGLGDTVADGSMHFIDRLNGLEKELGFREFTAQRGATLNLVAMALTLMIGTAGMPHVIIRFFTVPKVSDARKSVGYALLFITVLFLCIPAVGAFARTYFLEAINNQPYANVPQWFNMWEGTGLITFNDLNGDGVIQYQAGENNELAIDRDILFLASPEIAKLPAWVIALVAAGGLAAALSTAAGLLLVISTAISHDLLKKQFVPHISDKQELLAARICSALAVGVGIYFGIHPPGFVMETIALAFGIAASALFPAIFMGIFSKKMNKEGAIAGMLAGLIFSVSYIVYFRFMGGDPDDYLFGISAQGVGLPGMILSFVVTLVVSRFYEAPPAGIQEMVEDMRYPENI